MKFIVAGMPSAKSKNCILQHISNHGCSQFQTGTAFLLKQIKNLIHYKYDFIVLGNNGEPTYSLEWIQVMATTTRMNKREIAALCVFHPEAMGGILMTDHFGSCLCGTVSFEVKGDFDSFYLCHCQYCQKDTGSAHAANLFSQTAKLVWRSGAGAVTSFTLPGTRHNKSFCKLCGSALPNTQIPGLLGVPAGCLDTEISMAPTAHIFLSSKAVWDGELGEVPGFEGLPD